MTDAPKTPLSPKVLAALAGSGAGAAVGTLIVWALGAFVWSAGYTADQVQDALSAVPSPVSGIVPILLAVAGAWASGWTVEDPLRTLGAQVQAATSDALAASYVEPEAYPEEDLDHDFVDDVPAEPVGEDGADDQPVVEPKLS